MGVPRRERFAIEPDAVNGAAARGEENAILACDDCGEHRSIGLETPVHFLSREINAPDLAADLHRTRRRGDLLRGLSSLAQPIRRRGDDFLLALDKIPVAHPDEKFAVRNRGRREDRRWCGDTPQLFAGVCIHAHDGLAVHTQAEVHAPVLHHGRGFCIGIFFAREMPHHHRLSLRVGFELEAIVAVVPSADVRATIRDGCRGFDMAARGKTPEHCAPTRDVETDDPPVARLVQAFAGDEIFSRDGRR